MDDSYNLFIKQLETIENESYYQDVILNISLIQTCQLREALGLGVALSMTGYLEAFQDLKSYGLEVSWLLPKPKRLH